MIHKNQVLLLRILYPLWALLGMYSLLYVPSQLIDLTDAQGTAVAIAANEFFYRLGILGSWVTQLLHILAVWYLFRLFKDIH